MDKRIKNSLVMMTIVIVLGAFGTMLFAGFQILPDYYSNTKIPGIVEGTAKVFDTQTYFTKNELSTASVEIDIDCNNTNNLDLSIGYKTPSYDLLDASHPTKEISLWNGRDLYPTKSIDCLAIHSDSLSINRLNMKWNLLEIGFSANEYVRAEERIWYLKIKKIDGISYGYERNITEEINGTLVTIPDYVPNINILNKFEITFNDIRFQTLLHPFFDGSSDIVVVIRGVNHEIGTENRDTAFELGLEQKVKSWSSYTTTDTGPNDQWAIVFATEAYETIYLNDYRFFVHGGYLFIFGEHPSSVCRHPNGIYDYGYSVMYCMDGSEINLPTRTCAKTDDGFLEAMYDEADNLLGNRDKLIVFVHCHGSFQWGYHVTITSESHNGIFGWTNVIRAGEHKTKVSAITNDGTYVFLWLDCCRGYTMGSWNSNQHNNHLEIWYYIPKGYQMAWTPDEQPSYYKYAYWQYNHSWYHACEAEWFFTNLKLYYPYSVTFIGDDIEEYFNDELHEDESEMTTLTYWGSHSFYI